MPNAPSSGLLGSKTGTGLSVSHPFDVVLLPRGVVCGLVKNGAMVDAYRVIINVPSAAFYGGLGGERRVALPSKCRCPDLIISPIRPSHTVLYGLRSLTYTKWHHQQ